MHIYIYIYYIIYLMMHTCSGNYGQAPKTSDIHAQTLRVTPGIEVPSTDPICGGIYGPVRLLCHFNLVNDVPDLVLADACIVCTHGAVVTGVSRTRATTTHTHYG